MNNLKFLREEYGITQKHLATIFNISQQSVHKYETGVAIPNAALLRELSVYFDTSIDYLLGWSPIPHPQTMTQPQLLTEEEWIILEKYRQLHPSTRNLLHSIINHFLPQEKAPY